ncbi:MAG TPA: hypothetical protein VGO50_16550 [Pyrinomonadaceae bacterium]|jgi:uncharacterized membrane protein|nr:hypothetical protein [Pyrinomonadaceae bacterium]
MQSNEFNTGVIKPVECMKEGWELIKNDYWLFFAITLVGLLIGGAIPLVLIGPMLCGVYLCFLQKFDGRKVEFGDLFKGFDYFMPALIATLILVGIFFVASMIFIVIPSIILMVLAGATGGKGGQMIALVSLIVFCVLMLIFGIIAACIHALIVFTHLLIVDRKLSGWDAMRLSAKGARHNLGGVVGFIALQILLSIVGMLALVIGAYLMLPIIYAGTTVMYRKIFSPINLPSNVPPSQANYPGAGFGQ